MALLDNYQTAIDATATAQHSLNSSTEENVRHMQSLEAEISKMKSSASEFANILGEGGAKNAIAGTVSAITTLINGLSALSSTSGTTKVAITALTIASIAFGKAWNANNVGNAISLVTRLGVTTDMVTASLGRATMGALAFTRALLLNPFTWITTAIIGATYFIGKQKELAEEQKRINGIVDESNLKFEQLKEKQNRLNNLGVEENINNISKQEIADIETQINSYNDLTKALQEYQQQKLVVTGNGDVIDFGYADNLEDLPEKYKELAFQLGINITQYDSMKEAIDAVNRKLLEHKQVLDQIKQGSIEYQIEQNNIHQTAVENAQAVVDMTNEYENLSGKLNKTSEESARYDQLQQALGISKERTIGIVQSEAQANLNLAQQYYNTSAQGLQAQQALLQSAYNGAYARMAVYQKEMEVLSRLYSSILSGKATAGIVGDFRILEESSIGNYYKNQVNELGNALESLKRQLGSTPKVGGGVGSSSKSDGGSKSGSSSSDDPEFLHLKNIIEIKDSYIAKVKAERELLDKSSKQYQSNLDEEIALLKRKQEVELELQKYLNSKANSAKSETDRQKFLKDAIDAQTEYEKFQKELNELNFEKSKSQLDQYDKTIQTTTNHISLLEQTLNLYDQGSTDYNKTLTQILEKQKQYTQQLKEKEIWLKKELKIPIFL
jgi:chromosome segregation ATPase